jgi:hypothetical protein
MNPLMSIPKILQTSSSEYLPRLNQPSLECRSLFRNRINFCTDRNGASFSSLVDHPFCLWVLRACTDGALIEWLQGPLPYLIGIGSSELFCLIYATMSTLSVWLALSHSSVRSNQVRLLSTPFLCNEERPRSISQVVQFAPSRFGKTLLIILVSSICGLMFFLFVNHVFCPFVL